MGTLEQQVAFFAYGQTDPISLTVNEATDRHRGKQSNRKNDDPRPHADIAILTHDAGRDENVEMARDLIEFLDKKRSDLSFDINDKRNFFSGTVMYIVGEKLAEMDWMNP